MAMEDHRIVGPPEMIFMHPRPLLLDLFCGAGGASLGYHRAGFDVIGVDLSPMPRYPFGFIRADALNILDTLILGGRIQDAAFDQAAPALAYYGWAGRRDIAAVHASPPCQEYSETRSLHRKEYPMLIEPLRERLTDLGVPYVIENVAGAKAHMIGPVRLCGTMFGLGSGGYELRRHRLFECSFDVPAPGGCAHEKPVVSVFGKRVHDRRRVNGHPYRGTYLDNQVGREALGIDWMTLGELCESIPPAYTEYVGGYLMRELAFSPAMAA
jgi:DNA (cytosine-5)-methyltransferase 1